MPRFCPHWNSPFHVKWLSPLFLGFICSTDWETWNVMVVGLSRTEAALAGWMKIALWLSRSVIIAFKVVLVRHFTVPPFFGPLSPFLCPFDGLSWSSMVLAQPLLIKALGSELQLTFQKERCFHLRLKMLWALFFCKNDKKALGLLL